MNLFEHKSETVVGKFYVPGKKDVWVGTSMLFEFPIAERWGLTLEGRRFLFFRGTRDIYVSKGTYDATAIGASYKVSSEDVRVKDAQAAEDMLNAARYEFG